MPIRNPFKKSQTAFDIHEQNNRDREVADKGFEQTNVHGAKPVDIKEPAEFKLSDINDSGVYLPPSPPAKERSFFSRTSTTSSYSNHRSVLSDPEPFNISRESFDSYRRSFDISARSPIPSYDTPPRQSVDSRRALNAYSPRPSFQEPQLERPKEVEDSFEDVGLNDEVKPKKRGLFSRFGDNSEATGSPTVETKPTSGHHNFLGFPGRKRGQSGNGSELKSMPDRSDSRTSVQVGGD